AGRAMSRHGALRQFKGRQIEQDLLKKGIHTKATQYDSLAEEAPLAYKDVEQVIESVHNSGISLKVCRLEPVGVIKG
ncbi:MAG: RtcB family protein, partial [Thermodesulfovibrionia bacterium]|nr:RtcB family protein [Thermodesulfovibrionia bacterium]